MKVHNCVQGSSEWLRLRMGIPTASEFNRILTPKGDVSKSAEEYMRELLCEYMMGRPLENFKSSWMKRGNELEAEAVAYYELSHDVETEVVGFVTNDAGTIGASPDRLVGDKGVLETKCPSPSVHIGYLLFNDHKAKYYPQLQGQLYVTERDYVDIVSYHPEMPTAIVRVGRDDAYLKLLDVTLRAFVMDLERRKVELKERGLVRETEPDPEPPEFISDADVEAILEAQRA